MGILMNALVYCVVFLILLGLSLWPVLAKNTKRRKWVLIAANVVFFIMLLGMGGSVADNRGKLISKQLMFFNSLKDAAELLERGDSPNPKIEPVSTELTDPERALDCAVAIGQQFTDQSRLLQEGSGKEAQTPIQKVEPQNKGVAK